MEEGGRWSADTYLNGRGQVAVPVHLGGRLPAEYRPEWGGCTWCRRRLGRGWGVLLSSETYEYYCSQCVQVYG